MINIESEASDRDILEVAEEILTSPTLPDREFLERVTGHLSWQQIELLVNLLGAYARKNAN
jgi:hypothetical protein